MNQIINLLTHLVAIFIGNLSYDFCFKKLNNKKLELNKKNLLIMLIITTLIYISNMYLNIEIKFYIVFIIMCINFKLLFKLSLKRTIISYILMYTILILFEIILSNILSTIGILTSNKGAMDLTYIKAFISFIIIIIEYIIFSVRKINKLLEKILLLFENNANILNISYLMFIATTILGILNINNFSTPNSTKLIFFLVIIFTILFIMIIKSKTKEEFLEESNKRLIEYNEKYGQFLDEYKIYKHNIKNKLLGMKVYGNKKINALIDDLLEEETTFSIKNNNLYNIPQGIKGIVAEKLYNIKINVIIENKLKNDPFIKLNPKEFNNISESIGICLDNAIEASMETDNPIIILDLYEEKENICIKIGNNYCNSIDIDELGDKYYSTKNRGSGLGLFSLKQNDMINENITLINDFYYIELKIKKHAIK